MRAEDSAPAGGAALDQVIGLTSFAVLVAAAMLWLGWRHRQGATDVLDRWGRAASRRIGGPGWAALPGLLSLSLLVFGIWGFMWDVSLHIGRGRDEGPLANPAHYFILIALFVVFLSGCLAVVMPRGEQPGPAAVRITRRWHAPVGGVLLAAVGLFALMGFPFDDVWHRLFGQDVTLWGPTHRMLIGGAALVGLSLQILEMEGAMSRGKAPSREGRIPPRAFIGAGSLLIGLSVFQAEFDFGVQQYREVMQPLMIAATAAVALVAVRVRFGRGATFVALVSYWLIRGIVVLLVGPVLGNPMHVMPLYLGCAVVVELIALVPRLRDRPLLFGAVAGLGIGTVGLALEKPWIDAMFRVPWDRGMWLEGLALAIPAAVTCGMAGSLLALAFLGELPARPVRRGVMALAAVTLVATSAAGIATSVPDDLEATIELSATSGSGSQRTAQVTATFSRPIAENPTWVMITAWQGREIQGGLVVEHLERIDDTTWRTASPVPVDGRWKTILRVAEGREMSAAAVHMPADEALGAPLVPALNRVTRTMDDPVILMQREQNESAGGTLWTAVTSVVLLSLLALYAFACWVLARYGAAVARTRAEQGSRASIRR